VNTLAILGAQWGDEGKGKIADLLSEKSDWVVRFNGGPNAGHTVADDRGEIKFHHLPSGSLHPDCKVLLGDGMVIDPLGLLEELEKLEEVRGLQPDIYLGARAHLIMPYHPVVEVLQKSKEEVGTTGRGIGPTYQDKAQRSGFRVLDLLADDFSDRLRERLEKLREMWNEPSELNKIEVEDYLDRLDELLCRLDEDRIVNTPLLLDRVISRGERVIFEGAQGALLDIDYGTYPFVTSSNPTFGGVGTGAGVAPDKVERRIGVVKAYTTRVGKGPMPTEDEGSLGEELREKGDEYGATTGRPRRCGPLDLVALKFSSVINGFTEIALTKMDVLTGFRRLKVADHYRLEGERVDQFPPSASTLEKCVPHYRSFDGWDEDIGALDSLEDFPAPAKEYVEFIEERLDLPVSILSVGKRRSETLFLS